MAMLASVDPWKFIRILELEGFAEVMRMGDLVALMKPGRSRPVTIWTDHDIIGYVLQDKLQDAGIDLNTYFAHLGSLDLEEE